MPTAWPLNPRDLRDFDLDHRNKSTPTVLTPVASGTNHRLAGVSASNPTDSDAYVIWTEDDGTEICRLTLNKGEDSKDKEWNMKPAVGINVQASIAGIHTHEWGWSGS